MIRYPSYPWHASSIYLRCPSRAPWLQRQGEARRTHQPATSAPPTRRCLSDARNSSKNSQEASSGDETLASAGSPQKPPPPIRRYLGKAKDDPKTSREKSSTSRATSPARSLPKRQIRKHAVYGKHLDRSSSRLVAKTDYLVQSFYPPSSDETRAEPEDPRQSGKDDQNASNASHSQSVHLKHPSREQLEDILRTAWDAIENDGMSLSTKQSVLSGLRDQLTLLKTQPSHRRNAIIKDSKKIGARSRRRKAAPPSVPSQFTLRKVVWFARHEPIIRRVQPKLPTKHRPLVRMVEQEPPPKPQPFVRRVQLKPSPKHQPIVRRVKLKSPDRIRPARTEESKHDRTISNEHVDLEIKKVAAELHELLARSGPNQRGLSGRRAFHTGIPFGDTQSACVAGRGIRSYHTTQSILASPVASRSTTKSSARSSSVLPASSSRRHASKPSGAIRNLTDDPRKLHYYLDVAPPNRRQLTYADKFFTAHRSKYIFSTTRFRSFPSSDGVPEVVFLGASNVGKSSILNALLGSSSMVRTGKNSGTTRQMNAFGIGSVRFAPRHSSEHNKQFHHISRTPSPDPGIVLVDTPGYGPYNINDIGQEILKYLKKRKELRMVFFLLPVHHELRKTDLQLLDLLRANGVPHQIVATKCDEVLWPQKHTWHVSQLDTARMEAGLSQLSEAVERRLVGRIWPKDEMGVTTASLKTLGEVVCTSCNVTCEAPRQGRTKHLGIDALRWAILRAAGVDVSASGKRQELDINILPEE